jgi:hypothetical protein
MYTHQYERERAGRDQDATEAMIRMRQPRSTGLHPDQRASVVATIAANVDNPDLTDAAFREFVRRSVR